jgi:glycosyltransferase involved in cell wall biosynthesis
MKSNTKIFIDLSEYSSNYHGGVSTFASGITNALIETIPPNEAIFLIFDSPNEADKFAIIEKTNISKIILNRRLRRQIAKLFHRLNYNLFSSYDIFRAIKYLEVPIKLRRLVQNQKLYCPTTYLNFHASGAFSLVSIHDCQEKRFPENFSNKQKLYREFQARYTLERSSAVQVSSKFVSDEFTRFFPRQFSKLRSPAIVQISEGVDLAFFKPKLSNREMRKFEIFLPSSFHVHKNHMELFEALRRLDGQNLIKVNLTGEGEKKNECIEIASTFKTIEVNFLGYIDKQDLLLRYQDADLVVVCSKYESSSLPILESLACNTPVVAADIPPHVELKERCGLSIELYPLGDAEALSLKILSFLRKPNTMNLHQQVEEFDWRKISEKYLLALKVKNLE